MSGVVRRVLLTLMVLASISLPAEAWSDAGHKIIATIAWRQLTPQQRQNVLGVLAHHPRYVADFREAMPDNLSDPEDRHEWTFLQAAIWPDIARGYPEELKERFHHSTWHYINHPLVLMPADRHVDERLKLNLHVRPPQVADESMNIVQTIRFARRELSDRRAPLREQALWLTWLCHTVGDLHQPLHATTMINAARLPEGDRGGNTIPTKQRGTLHTLWDNFPGGKLQLAESRKRALTWMNDPELRAQALPSERVLNEEVWWQESRQLSETVAYDEEVRTYLKQLPPRPIDHETPKLTLSEDYLERGGRIARMRILEAGLRLGAVLREVFP